MRFPTLPTVLAATILTSCASTQGNDDLRYGFGGKHEAPPSHRISGIVGVTEAKSNIEVAPEIGTVVRDNDLTVPMIAAAWQYAPHSERLEFGFEAGFSLGWETDRQSVAIGNGTVVVFADNSVRLFDVSIGAFLATMLGERIRLYGGVGPVLQWASVDLDFEQEFNGIDGIKENGFGYGYYVRVGLEYEVQRGMGVGLVARWLDTEVDMGGRLGDYSIEAVQVGLVVTTGF